MYKRHMEKSTVIVVLCFFSRCSPSCPTLELKVENGFSLFVANGASICLDVSLDISGLSFLSL